ncbi:MAG: RNA polymerase sigma factor [Pirellulaceae bacterium]|nr:RNA polymerase sigma factor [Pirellulaceae bacterium]HJN12071.1 RNA polymerase sigma factor [Pirellulaceae bacterium]
MAVLVHHDEERRLIAALVARNRDAWSEFVERFQGLVYARVARTALEFNDHLDRSAIEDIRAEIFAALIENDFASLRRFEGRSSLATWLAIIARRSCLRWMQKRSQRQEQVNQRIDDLQQEDIVGGASEDILAALIQTEDGLRLRTMLGRLNEGDRSVLQMFFMDGLSYAQISRGLGISINSVGPKLQRAQKRLRQLMETDGQRTANHK